MPPPRRKTFDETEKGKKAQSAARNRGADRVLDVIKDYQEVTKHKVLVNFIPTWPKGVPRVWLSHPANEITPLKMGATGKVVPFYGEQAQPDNHEEEDRGDFTDQETPPGSQRMGKKSAAAPGSKQAKKDMKQRCGHCCTGPNMDDLHPNSAWIKCGERGCRSANHMFHAICHGIKLSKVEEKSFNKKYVRCLDHHTKKKKHESDEEVSDDDFQTKKKKKKVLKKSVVPSKVYTPGTKDLPPLKKASHSKDQEKGDTISDSEHGDKEDEEDEEEVQIVTPVKSPSREDESDEDMFESPSFANKLVSSKGPISPIIENKNKPKPEYGQYSDEDGDEYSIYKNRSDSDSFYRSRSVVESNIQPEPTYASKPASKPKEASKLSNPESAKSVHGAEKAHEDPQSLQEKGGKRSKLSRTRNK